MNHRAPLAILVPTRGEFTPYGALLPDLQPLASAGAWELYEAALAGRRLLLILSAAGPVNAAAATERLIAQFAPAAVLHGGSAGAHNPALMPGDVVVGSRFVIVAAPGVREARIARGLPGSLIRFYRYGEMVSLEYIDAQPELLRQAEQAAAAASQAAGPWQAPGWPQALPRRAPFVVSGVVGSADAWTIEAEALRELRVLYQAECEDMESAYVAQVCAMHGVPFAAIRVMSDNEAACALTPEEVPAAITEAGDRAARSLLALAATLTRAGV
ncbi:MAG TPA: 5'-methylthioadenosine/S-adenosylhomocysteine nucleosidase [Dehalococcoidia bacterium]|nr:5'-methylthioadenosine/S-adenosylhomocysteine nucleosidase [Dehalococcoidia bacterium]